MQKSQKLIAELITKITPVKWYGQRVAERYSALNKLIATELGREYALLLSRPEISQTAYEGKIEAAWYTDTTAVVQQLIDCTPTVKAGMVDLLASRLKQVQVFGERLLLSEKEENVKWGQLVLKAVVYPGPDYVYTDGTDVFIAAWGFEYREGMNPGTVILFDNYKGHNQESPAQAPSMPTEVHQDNVDTVEEEPAATERISSTINNDSPVSEEGEIDEIDHIAPDNEKSPIDEVTDDPPSIDRLRRTSNPWWHDWKRWLLLLISLLLLILLLSLLFRSCGSRVASAPASTFQDGNIDQGRSSNSGATSPSDGSRSAAQGGNSAASSRPSIARRYILPAPADSIYYHQPVDTTTLLIDSASHKYILPDLLNVVLHGKNKDIDAFTLEFKAFYPGDEFKIIYGDYQTARLQLKLPRNQVTTLKDKLPAQMPAYELLIWHESIFSLRSKPTDPILSNRMKSWFFSTINAYEAWEVTTGDSGVVVAVLDSGFDLDHEELVGRSSKPYNAAQGNNKNLLNRLHADHGTHIASIIGATHDNDKGACGIAPTVKMMPVVVSDETGVIRSSYIIDGMLYAINNGAKVINMSLGTSFDPLLASLPVGQQTALIGKLGSNEGAFWTDLYKIAETAGVSIVLAGGNQNVAVGIDPLQHSSYPIMVSAVDSTGNKTTFSNWGLSSTISAPGQDIFGATPNNTYEVLSGTSMAAPIVAGALALVYSVAQDLTPQEAQDILVSSAQPVAAVPTRHIGALLDIGAAVRSAAGSPANTSTCSGVQQEIDSLENYIMELRKRCGL